MSRLDFIGRTRLPPLLVALAAVAALGLSACGSDGADLLPGETASEITSNLDQVRELVAAGECVGAADAAQEVSAEVDALGGVDEKLKQALQEGASRLNEVVVDCEEAPEEETEPAVETAIEPEAEEPKKEKAEKPEKTKPEKEVEEEPEPEPEEEAESTLPPQAKGKAKGHETQEETAPPVEPSGGTPAGGVEPATPAEGGE